MKKKVLLVAEAVTLAHVCRTLALAAALDRKLFDVHIAFDRRYESFLPGDLQRDYSHLPCIPSQVFLKRSNSFKFAHTAREIREYVLDDLRLLDEVKPDCVIADFRISMAISARKKSIPYLSLANGYWLPEYQGRMQIPDHPATWFLPGPLREFVYNFASPMIFNAITGPFNQVAAEHGVEKARGGLRRVFTQADHILLAEPAGWLSIGRGPVPFSCIGPVSWTAQRADPTWWDRVDWGRPAVYVSVGSSGSARIINLVLEATRDMDLQILVSGVRSVKAGSRRQPVFCSEFIANAKALEKASLFISNGGSLSMVDALRFGRPVLGIASNFDQWQNVGTLRDRGVGDGFVVRNLTPETLGSSIESLLRPTARQLENLGKAKEIFSGGINKKLLEDSILSL